MFITPTQRDNLAAAINFTLHALTTGEPRDRARAATHLSTAIVDMLDPTYDPKQASEASRLPSSSPVGVVLAAIPGYDADAHRAAYEPLTPRPPLSWTRCETRTERQPCVALPLRCLAVPLQTMYGVRCAQREEHRMSDDPRLPERFWSKVQKTDTCWLWVGYCDPSGYGKFQWNVLQFAHRVSHSELVGPIPEGFQVDHLCSVRHCVRPDHLEAVTPLVNALRSTSFAAEHARQTHCSKGHPLSGDNLKVQTSAPHRRPYRRCRTCIRATDNRYAARKRASA